MGVWRYCNWYVLAISLTYPSEKEGGLSLVHPCIWRLPAFAATGGRGGGSQHPVDPSSKPVQATVSPRHVSCTKERNHGRRLHGARVHTGSLSCFLPVWISYFQMGMLLPRDYTPPRRSALELTTRRVKDSDRRSKKPTLIIDTAHLTPLR